MKLKKFSIYIFMIAFFWACDTKSEKTIQDIDLNVKTEEETVVKPRRAYTLETQSHWLDYYKSENTDFDMSNFKKEDSFKIERMKTNLTPIWNPEFNPVYKQFLAFNADSTQYIDFDSYKWGFDDKGELIIGPDQEIVLVNIPEKKVERLLFYGPSFWVEEAYFKNDSIVVLLENSSENVPAYQEININQNTSDYYIYESPLEFHSDYLKRRVMSIYDNPM